MLLSRLVSYYKGITVMEKLHHYYQEMRKHQLALQKAIGRMDWEKCNLHARQIEDCAARIAEASARIPRHNHTDYLA